MVVVPVETAGRENAVCSTPISVSAHRARRARAGAGVRPVTVGGLVSSHLGRRTGPETLSLILHSTRPNTGVSSSKRRLMSASYRRASSLLSRASCRSWFGVSVNSGSAALAVNAPIARGGRSPRARRTRFAERTERSSSFGTPVAAEYRDHFPTTTRGPSRHPSVVRLLVACAARNTGVSDGSHRRLEYSVAVESRRVRIGHSTTSWSRRTPTSIIGWYDAAVATEGKLGTSAIRGIAPRMGNGPVGQPRVDAQSEASSAPQRCSLPSA